MLFRVCFIIAQAVLLVVGWYLSATTFWRVDSLQTYINNNDLLYDSITLQMFFVQYMGMFLGFLSFLKKLRDKMVIVDIVVIVLAVLVMAYSAFMLFIIGAIGVMEFSVKIFLPYLPAFIGWILIIIKAVLDGITRRNMRKLEKVNEE